MASSSTLSALSTATRKRKQSEESASVAVKREKPSGAHTDAIEDDDDSDWLDCSSTPSNTRVANGRYSAVPAGPATPDALVQRLASLQHLSYAVSAHAVPAQSDQTNGSLFDRPNPLVAGSRVRKRCTHTRNLITSVKLQAVSTPRTHPSARLVRPSSAQTQT